MKIRRAIALLAALMLVATACGDDGGTTTEAPQASTTTTTASPQPPDEPATTTTTALVEVTPTTGDVGKGDVNPIALGGVLAAFNQTTESSSGRMEGSFSMIGVEGLPGGSMEIPFSGAFAANGDYSFALDMSGLGAMGGEEIPPEFASLLGEMEMRQVGDTSYIKFPFFSMFLGVETDWISTPADDSSQVTGGFGLAAPTSPTAILESFGDANATISDLGRETVNGLETTHYRVFFDTAALYELASPDERAELESQRIPEIELPMDVWITDDGILVRFVMDIDGSDVPATTDVGGFERMLVTYDLFDLGKDVTIQAPPPNEVTDSEALGDLFSFELGG